MRPGPGVPGPHAGPAPDIFLSHMLGLVHCSWDKSISRGFIFHGKTWDNTCPSCPVGWFLKTKQIDNLHNYILIKLHINVGITRKTKRDKKKLISPDKKLTRAGTEFLKKDT